MVRDDFEERASGSDDEHGHNAVLYESAYGAGLAAEKQQSERPSPVETANAELPTDKPAGSEPVTISGAGNRVTLWEDGSRRVDRIDGTWILHKPTGDGGYREEHGGNQRPEENFVLVKSKDGRFDLAESMNEQAFGLPLRYEIFSPIVKSDSPAHKAVAELAEAKILDPQQLAKFRADMIRFEERMANRDLSSLEADTAYREIERLLRAEGDKPLTAERRVQLAQQVMSQLATPTCIDQGYHNTCNVSTIETRTYVRHPAIAAQLVADVALTGKYQAQDGTVVTLDPESLQPDPEAQRQPPAYGDRSFASQLFQVTAVNIHWAKYNETFDPPRQLRYEQRSPDPNANPPDTGERLVDYTTGTAKINATQPHLYDSAIVKVSCAITGESQFDEIFIGHKEKELGSLSGLTIIGSEAELVKTLDAAAKNGNLPIIISVDSRFEPFWTDNYSGSAGGAGGAHVVTITEYYPGPPARVGIDNQWGAKTDHRGENSLPVHDLYLATRSPEFPSTIRDLRQDVELNRKNGTVDTIKELTLLRLEDSRKRMPDQEYDAALLQHMTDAERRWDQQRSNATFSDGEYARAFKCLARMLAALPANRRTALVDRLRTQALGDRSFKQLEATMHATA